MGVSGKYLFTFAVIADTHMNQDENYSSSPYPCNALANARTRRVVAELNQAKPEFVVHLGDIINPVPELPAYTDAARHFKTLVADLEAPLYLVPGNHDVGDKPVSWMPAGTVNEENLELYQRHFGDHYYSFDSNDLHIVIINAQIINSGLVVEEEQRLWLEKDLAANAARRTFVNIHYPPYVSNPSENGTYDNIDEPGRAWLLGLLGKHKPEAMFCGHVHNFWYDVCGETEIYILPSTAFVRHDYSEMYRIGPGDQYGRNDEPKLGYFFVRVYERGHVVENFRTYGRTLLRGSDLPAKSPRVKVPQTKESNITSVGLDMRHAWAEELVIAPSGGVDEFERKLARNDYPVLALWEMGMRRMRVPIQDLIDDRTRGRMKIMKNAGHLFQVYSYGLPASSVRRLLASHAEIIDCLEIVINWEQSIALIPGITKLHDDTGVPIYLSRVNRKDTNKHTGGRYNHLISHGFVLDEADELAEWYASHDKTGAIAGTVFYVMRDQYPARAALRAGEAAERLGRSACLYIKTTSGSPAEDFVDDAANVNRFAEAAAVGIGVEGVEVIIDTFDDVDRGYFARSGLVDRRFNPKMGSRVIGNLFGMMNKNAWALTGDAHEIEGARVLSLTSDSGEELALVLPPPEGVSRAALLSGQENPKTVNLNTGVVENNYTKKISVPTALWLE